MEALLCIPYHLIDAYEEEDEDEGGRVTTITVDFCEHNVDCRYNDSQQV